MRVSSNLKVLVILCDSVFFQVSAVFEDSCTKAGCSEAARIYLLGNQ